MAQRSTYYLAGPMGGIAELNFPLFKEAAKILRGRGLQIVSPVELAEALPGEIGTESELPYSEYMREDIRGLMNCDNLLLLPHWQQSRGARLEVYLADFFKMKVWDVLVNDDFKVRRNLGHGSQEL